MEAFIIDVPVPSMGATVSELNVISIRVKPGAQVKKGDKVAELESDKSAFEYEAPCDGVVRAILAEPGQVISSGMSFIQFETTDESLRHLELKAGAVVKPAAPIVAPVANAAVIWTPRATKLAQEAGLDPAKLTGIEATGPGGRVSGDDVQRYIAKNTA